MSQIERAKLGLSNAEVRFWLVVMGLMVAFGVTNALADVVLRVLV